MSTAAATKPPGTPRREVNTRTSSSSPGAANRTPARSSTPTTNGAAAVSKTRSVRGGANGTPPVSARAAVKKPAASSNLSSTSQADSADDDAREEQASLLQELKERLQKAESEAEERQKQVEILNARLDEALTEQAKLEERAHEEEEKVESLENVKRELTRQHRELEGIYEAERAQAMKEKEETQSRQEEMQSTIQRLKETMATKNMPTGELEEEQHLSRACKSLPLNQPGHHVDTKTHRSKLPQQSLTQQLLTESRKRRFVCTAQLRPAQQLTKQLEAHPPKGQDYRRSASRTR
jgi:chromosome segregation ATPase